MNINKLQAQLQHVPDQALIGYVQNPNGQVPSYLALAELSRRKEIRKSAQPQQTAPTQTIAQQEVAQAAPGIAQLPVREDMFNEQSMAAGGIVAFEGGGEVQHFYQGGYPISAPGLSEDDVAYAEAMRNNSVTPALGTLYDYTIGLPFNMIGKGVDYLKGRQPVYDPEQGKYVLQRDLPPVDTKAAEEAAFKAKNEAGLKERKDYLNANPSVNPAFAATQQNKTAQFLAEQAKKDLNDPYYKARVAAGDARAKIEADIRAGKYSPKTPADAAGAAANTAGAGKRVTPAGIGSLYTPPTDISGEYEGLMRPEDDARAGMDRYFGLIGEDKGRAAVQERLGKMEEKAARDEAQAPWMALAEAGLGMAAGKSPFALQNIAEGGKQGIKSYVDSKDRLVKAEERRFDMASKIAQADRAEQVAAATYGLQSEERAKAHNDAVKQAKIGYKADREAAIAQGNFNANKFNLEYKQKDREIDLMGQRIDKQIASAESQGLRYELQNKRDSLKTALNELNDQIKTEQGSINPDPKKLASLQTKFDSAYNALYSLAMQSGTGTPTGKKAPIESFNLK